MIAVAVFVATAVLVWMSIAIGPWWVGASIGGAAIILYGVTRWMRGLVKNVGRDLMTRTERQLESLVASEKSPDRKDSASWPPP